MKTVSISARSRFDPVGILRSIADLLIITAKFVVLRTFQEMEVKMHRVSAE